MNSLTKKLKPLSGGSVEGWVFHCPGCDCGHVFYTTGPITWEFNGNLESPSFTPSLLNTCENHPDPKQRRCHLVMTEGKIHYCPDCSHDLVGQIIDLPDLEW